MDTEDEAQESPRAAFHRMDDFNQRVTIRVGCQMCKQAVGVPCIRLHPSTKGPKGSFAVRPHDIRVWDYRDVMGQRQRHNQRPPTHEVEAKKGGGAPNRGLGKKVLNYILDHPSEIHTSDRISNEFGVNNHAASNALHNLKKGGYLERKALGAYVLLPQWHPGGVPGPEPEVVQVATEAAWKVHAAQQAEDKQFTYADEPAPANDRDIEDEVNAVLELLFPQGVQAHHFKDILRWQNDTFALIRKVRGDG